MGIGKGWEGWDGGMDPCDGIDGWNWFGFSWSRMGDIWGLGYVLRELFAKGAAMGKGIWLLGWMGLLYI